MNRKSRLKAWLLAAAAIAFVIGAHALGVAHDRNGLSVTISHHA